MGYIDPQDSKVFLSRRKLEIMSLHFCVEIGRGVIPKLEIMLGALIMDSTGLDPRGAFAVIQTLGSK